VLPVPLDLPDERRRAFEREVAAFEARATERIDALLGEVDDAPARAQLNRLVFSANEVLPKRDARPGRVSLLSAYLVEQLHVEYAGSDPESETRRDRLVQFTLAVEEYADVVDDLVDGDVAEGRETEVLLTLQVLWPQLVRLLSALGQRETEYWTQHATALVAAPVTEMTREPGADTYRELVAEQATLFGFVTGLAAVAAGEDEPTVARAERLGELFFSVTQFLLDCEQYDGEEAWNALAVMAPAEVRERLRAWQRAFETELEHLSAERTRRLRPLVAVDLEAWDGPGAGPGE
jgi:hypothetical protein